MPTKTSELLDMVVIQGLQLAESEDKPFREVYFCLLAYSSRSEDVNFTQLKDRSRPQTNIGIFVAE